ncbi:hypothetical protein AOX55_00001211 [Sinorhizobium fredii CCBAU 25509]|nr:hypothetical protein AOX55_00001211 [Sinorhizobium fredii CCBAU 25509]
MASQKHHQHLRSDDNLFKKKAHELLNRRCVQWRRIMNNRYGRLN